MKQQLFLLAALILTTCNSVSSEFVALGNAIHLSWTYTKTNIMFTLEANTTGWAAIGFSPNGGMTGADIVIIAPQNGSITIQDCYATGMSRPAIDSQQDYKLLSGSARNGHLRAVFYRLLDTCDPKDAVIKSYSMKIIVAYGVLNSLGEPQYHGPNQRTSVSIHLLTEEPAPPNDVGVFYIDPIPQNISITNNSDTIYWCSLVKLPQLTKKTHIIEMRPMITTGNEDIVHHMLMYICEAPVNVSVNSFDCYDGSDPGNQNNCTSLIGIWGVGGTTFRFPENVGLPLERGTSGKYVLIQTHYTNMGHVSGRVDSSYIRFIVTQTLREIDAGIIQTGVVNGLLIPPNTEKTIVSGYCSSDCLSSSILPATGINAFAVTLHSHLLGSRMALRHFRPAQGVTLPVIVDDPLYDFGFQQAIHLDSPRVILPGDVLQTVCVMNSTKRNVATQGGPGTMHEMCLSFLLYYPKVGLEDCQTFPSWISTPNHTMYKLLDRNFSSFIWDSGVNDGLLGVHWSSELIHILQNGYFTDVNDYFCRVDQKYSASTFRPPTSASSWPPAKPSDTQPCVSTNSATNAGVVGVLNYGLATATAVLIIAAITMAVSPQP